jgi:hypothetical protein
MAEPTAPLFTRILQAMATAINTGMGAGTAIRPAGEHANWVPVNGKVIILAGDATPRDDRSTVGNPAGQAFSRRVVCQCIVAIGESSTTVLDDAIELKVAAVEAAIMTDPSCGGLALDVRPAAITMLTASQDGCDGAAVEFEVLYRVSEKNHTQQV